MKKKYGSKIAILKNKKELLLFLHKTGWNLEIM